MINPITKFERLSQAQRQWVWFVILWCGGLLGVTIMAGIVKLIMGL